MTDDGLGSPYTMLVVLYFSEHMVYNLPGCSDTYLVLGCNVNPPIIPDQAY